MTANGEVWTTQVSRLLAPNPGVMTLDGTNTLVIRRPGSPRAVVVDPGPLVASHVARIQAQDGIELVLLTHHHVDHTESAARVHELTGAPVRAADDALCIGAPPLRDGERVDAGGTAIEVIATPGHTSDSVCFALPDDRTAAGGGAGSILTGDTILGRGSTVIAPTGALGDYLASLERLRRRGGATVLPGHGDVIARLDVVCSEQLAHRHARLAAIRALLEREGVAPSTRPEVVRFVTDTVYADTSPEVRAAAELSVAAQLEHLAASGG
ncbi:MAG: MBL fold metallo-hydrolase [Microbacterium sp.]